MIQEALLHDTARNPQAPAEAFIDRLNTIDPEHRLGNPDYRAEVLTLATPDEVLEAVQQTNTDLYGAENPVFDRFINLGRGEGLDRKVGYVGLHPEHAREVFDYAVTASQRLIHAEGPDALDKAGIVVAGTIVGTQMFTDGNKRTARAAYLAIAEGYDGSDAARARYTDVLSFTQEARHSMFFNAHSPSARRAFTCEGLDADEARATARFGSAWESHQPSRVELDGLLADSVTDPELRKSCIDVLQQNTFGSDAIVGLMGYTPEPAEGVYISPELAAPVIAQAKEAIAQITPETAQQIIDNDAERKKEFMLRMIDSTTGERPLHYVSDRGVTQPDIIADFVNG